MTEFDVTLYKKTRASLLREMLNRRVKQQCPAKVRITKAEQENSGGYKIHDL